MEYLFSYGTLQLSKVQEGVFGRHLKGVPDFLVGFNLEDLTVTDPKVIELSGTSVHRILVPSNSNSDTVAGMVFEVTAEELSLADKYEVQEYVRVPSKTGSGKTVWAYLERSRVPLE